MSKKSNRRPHNYGKPYKTRIHDNTTLVPTTFAWCIIGAVLLIIIVAVLYA